MKLHYISIVHNWVLILWSAAMNIGIVVAIARRTMRMGFYRAALCPSDLLESNADLLSGDLGFWLYNFHISKYYELIDTVLLILKGKKLIFLHVFHHFIMLFLPFVWFYDAWIVGAWYCTFVNTAVHVAMYYYYFLTAIGQRPRWKSLMTTGQIVQLFSGWLLVWFWLYVRNRDGCTRGMLSGMLSHTLNTALIVFFGNFFYQQYMKPRKPRTDATQKKRDE